MQNLGWFYKGVRYAKDGRYACYCDTPQKKAEVLLKEATCTLAIDNGGYRKGARLTPWNVSGTSEIIVTYPDDSATASQDFTDSNYFIIQLASTGQYYCYYIDYIEPYQQMTESGNVVAYPNNVTFRVGLSIDIWQSYFFKMRTKITEWDDKPQQYAPHDRNGFAANEVVMPKFDFANIQRTNLNHLLQSLTYNQFPLLVPPFTRKSGNGKLTNGFEFNYGDPELTKYVYFPWTEWEIVIRMQLTENKAALFGTKSVGIYYIVLENNTINFPMGATDFSKLIHTTSGIYKLKDVRIANDWKEAEIGLTPNYPYSSPELEATPLDFYLIPRELVTKCLKNPTGWNAPVLYEGTYTLSPAGTGFGTIKGAYVYLDIANLNATNQGTSIKNVSKLINVINPHLGDIGTNEERTPLTGAPPILSYNEDTKLIAPKPSQSRNIQVSVSCEYDYQHLSLYISTGGNRIDLGENVKISQLVSVNGEAIRQRAQLAEQKRQAKIWGSIGAITNGAAAVATGNYFGAVQSAESLARTLSSDDSISINAIEFKGRPTGEQTVQALPAIIYIASYISDPTELVLSSSTETEINEFGFQVNLLFTNIESNLLLNTNNALTTLGKTIIPVLPYSYIQMGAVIQNIAQDSGEWLERRFREGVTFYYE